MKHASILVIVTISLRLGRLGRMLNVGGTSAYTANHMDIPLHFSQTPLQVFNKSNRRHQNAGGLLTEPTKKHRCLAPQTCLVPNAIRHSAVLALSRVTQGSLSEPSSQFPAHKPSGLRSCRFKRMYSWRHGWTIMRGVASVASS